MVKALVLRSAGVNCNDELQKAFELAGATAEQVHINDIISGKKKLADYDILALPGGFSYGDYISAGTILANQLTRKLKKEMDKFVKAGKLVIGICNGFQVLVKTGYLPGTLTNNDSGRFECRWVKLTGIMEIDVPVAHGEGKYVADEKTLKELEENNQIIFRYSQSSYPQNPNGSMKDIAGICSKDGKIIGIMPHPERNLTSENYDGEGLKLFKKIIERGGIR